MSYETARTRSWILETLLTFQTSLRPVKHELVTNLRCRAGVSCAIVDTELSQRLVIESSAALALRSPSTLAVLVVAPVLVV